MNFGIVSELVSGRGHVTVALSSSLYYTTLPTKGRVRFQVLAPFSGGWQTRFKLELLGIKLNP